MVMLTVVHKVSVKCGGSAARTVTMLKTAGRVYANADTFDDKNKSF